MEIIVGKKYIVKWNEDWNCKKFQDVIIIITSGPERINGWNGNYVYKYDALNTGLPFGFGKKNSNKFSDQSVMASSLFEFKKKSIIFA